ncbi:MAG: hypothetical protein KUG81_08245 [Gammaproteobacteria bacterium]|nr:hypothetical protein [Gammaproteobacteria bacterium]
MTNIFNSAIIYMSTGSSNVVGLDLVFKFSNSNIPNVVEKYDKEDLGWSDNSTVFVTFTNKKVYTTLNENELFRLFDNVPHKAQAQTIMDNRLDFGNYVDGYNVVDEDGDDCKILFSPELISNPIEKEDLIITRSATNYTIGTAQTVENSTITIDMSNVVADFIEGSRVTISLTLAHRLYVASSGTTPSTTPPSVHINVSLTLTTTYASVAALVASSEFEAAIGETTFTPISDCGTVDAGDSLTDQINCGTTTPFLPPPGWTKDNSGVTAADQGIQVSTSGDTFSLSMIAMRYELIGTPGTYVYEYFEVVFNSASFYKYDIGRSLHSKRDNEVAIIYMDEYSRSTTALVSSDNTVYIDPNKSILRNNIRVTIPPTQKPPYWATKYKFALKPSEIDYEIIYSNIFFNEETEGTTYFLLEGDNQNKCSIGDRLRVKHDISGAILNDIEATVIDISAKQRNFMINDFDIDEPSGIYMQIKASNFNVNYLDGYIQDNDLRRTASSSSPYLLYPVYSENPSYDSGLAINPSNTPYLPWEVPAGSQVEITIRFEGEDGGGNTQDYSYVKTYTASQDYNNMYDFVQGDNIQFDTGEAVSDGSNTSENEYLDELYDFILATGDDYITTGALWPDPPISPDDHRYQFSWYNPNEASPADPSSGQMYMGIRNANTGTGILPVCEARVRIISGGNLFVFETIPTEADPNVFYESSDNFDITGGFHTGDIQTQTALLAAIVDLTFFDCFSFGNGVESYKIGDGLANPSFRLGERFYAVSEEDYKEAHRYADITYSGIYNAETNINRLNEFNLSLANFKTLEKSFGAIRVLSARASDILVLQEDKISYVLSSKALISSSAGGGTISSIPEVLGTQIARIENYGISNNPESYAEWGYDKFFTDVKRGAVIKLTGSGTQEQLSVISDLGMKSWFRDYLRLTPNKQKLGGYDPYMGEYVLGANLNSTPSNPFTASCGSNVTRTTSDVSTEWEVLLEPGSGIMTITYTLGILPPGENVTINMTYDGSGYSTGAVTSSGTFNVTKVVGVDTATIEVVLSSSFETTYAVNVGCAVEQGVTVTQVALSNDDAGVQYIHNDFYWTQDSYISPTQSNLVLLQNTSQTINVAQYQVFDGRSGTGMIPPSSGPQVTIRIQSTKRDFDDFTFGSSLLKYVESQTEFTDSQNDITNMLAAATTLTPLVNPTTGVYYYDVSYSASNYIYLIYDYR